MSIIAITRRQVFDVDWSDPLLYDLSINTDRVSPETGVVQILRLVQAAESQASGHQGAGAMSVVARPDAKRGTGASRWT